MEACAQSECGNRGLTGRQTAKFFTLEDADVLVVSLLGTESVGSIEQGGGGRSQD
jgi:hypothetical protein